jgi:hypothetical protein
MRLAVSLVVLLLATAAAPSPRMAQPQIRELTAPQPDRAVCRDRIDLVRDERGLSRLDRASPSDDEALLIAAVDHRIDGCSVMVMRADTSDVRPLPAPDGPARLQRIPGQ